MGAPIIGLVPAAERSDPLPQAMVLTAIVITMGVSAFVLSMAYRSFQLNGHDEVQDDVEDARTVSCRPRPGVRQFRGDRVHGHRRGSGEQ